jgi:hypothetical protein
MDEAVYLVKKSGIGCLSSYYIGTLPFILAFLYFWSEMCQSAFATQQAFPASLLMALLFCWMKTWQSWFCFQLEKCRRDEEYSFSFKKFIDIAINQTMLQPLGLLALPLALILILPFGIVHAFFQNITVLGDNNKTEQKLHTRAFQFSRLYSFQNYVIIWLLSPWLLAFTLIVCFGGGWIILNILEISPLAMGGTSEAIGFFIGVLLLILIWPNSPLSLVLMVNFILLFAALPWFLHSFLGIETIFQAAGFSALANTTLISVMYCCVYLILDPLLKASYTLRCFYSMSLENGADLLSELKPFLEVKKQQSAKKSNPNNITAALILTFFFLSVTSCIPSLNAKEMIAEQDNIELSEQAFILDNGIKKILQQPKYNWRIPRQYLTGKNLGITDWLLEVLKPFSGSLESFFKWLGRIIKYLVENLSNLFSWDDSPVAPEIPDLKLTRLSAFLVGGFTLVLTFFLFRNWRRKKKKVEPVQGIETAQKPNLEDQSVTADLLPEDEWMAMARKMIEKQEYRLGLRALYLATLALLEHQRLIALKPYKSNHDYLNEIRRRIHNYPDLPAVFLENIFLFECSWYGEHQVNQGMLDKFLANQDKIRGNFGLKSQ